MSNIPDALVIVAEINEDKKTEEGKSLGKEDDSITPSCNDVLMGGGGGGS